MGIPLTNPLREQTGTVGTGVVLAGSLPVRGLMVLVLLAVSLTTLPANAAILTVTKTADTNDGVCNADCSLREAITVANGNGVPDTIDFNIPLADPGYNAGTGVFTINVSPTPLPPLINAGTTIDGTTQTTNVGNTNPVMLGTGGTVGVGPDGVISTGDEPALGQVAGPEIEIRNASGAAVGLHIQSNTTTIRGLAIVGFGAADGDASIRIDNNFTGALIEQNVLGTLAHSYSDPGVGSRSYTGFHSEGGDSGIVRNNLIGYTTRQGIWLITGSTSWTVQGNEVRDAGLGLTDGDGIALSASGTNTVAANRVSGSSSQGLVVNGAGSDNNTFINNTVTGNGVGIPSGVAQSTGVTARGSAGPTVFERNVIHANYGAGVQVNNGATAIRMTLNSFADNGTIIARDASPPTGQIGIDLNLPGDNANFGTSPFYTANDSGDGDSGGNTILNFPVINTATIVGPNLTLTGWARPGSVIEFYIADGQVPGFGEGEVYLTTLTEGSGADADAGSSLYVSPINGLPQGTDNTNQFSFTIPTPTGVSAGTEITATATIGANTSEFSGIVTVLYNISGRVFEDLAGDVLNDGPIAGAANPAYVGVTVDLYLDDGDNIPEATDTSVASTTTAAGGVYSFNGVAPGVYWVLVDSATLYSNQDGGALPADIWAEQSYGGIGARCADGSGGTSVRVTAGPCYGGNLGNRSDDASAPDSAEHLARVEVTTANIVDVDFGFSFNIVTTTRGADGTDDDPPATNGRTVQGSLFQFSQNANAISGANGMRFVPAEPTNAAGSGQTWWRITVTSPLNMGSYDTYVHYSDADTTVDGRAFDLADGLTIRDTNTAAIGLNETVGVDAIYTTPTLDPELEIFNDAVVFGIDRGIDVQADRTTIRHIAIYGFGVDVIEADIIVGENGAAVFIDGVIIEDNVVGSNPVATADPGATGSRRRGIFISRTTNGVLRRNIVRYTDEQGVALALFSTGWTITENEISSAGIATSDNGFVMTNSVADFNGNLVALNGADGLLNSATNVVTADNNTFRDNADDGFTVIASSTATLTKNIIRDNTDVGALLATTGNSLTENLIQNNGGAGIQVRNGALDNELGQNLFGGNGGIAIDLVDGAVTTGITPNTSAPPACGYDAGTFGNDGLDFPVIAQATTTAVSGAACPGSRVEIYRAVADPDFSDNTDPVGGTGINHGEGVAYLGFATAAGGTGLFSLTGITGLSIGDEVSAIAIDTANKTSEFAAAVKAGLVMQKAAFWPDGTPIGDGESIPVGVEFKFMLYINNLGPLATDVSIRDVLDPLFAYQAGTIQIDNSVASCAAQVCTPAEESAIFASAIAAPLRSDAVDGDTVSFASATVDAGNQHVANAQLDIAGTTVLAVVFSAKVQ